MVDFFKLSIEFVSACAFRKYVMSGIIAITNINRDSASPRKIPIWIFT